MRRRCLAIRILKWTATVSSMLVAAVLLVSAWWCVYTVFVVRATGIAVWTVSGQFFIDWYEIKDVLAIDDPWPSLSMRPNAFAPSFGIPYSLFIETQGPPHSRIGLPLMSILVAFLVLTLLLWHRDRRPRSGHCQDCGYNMTGNTSGRCPECGEAA